MDNIKLQDVNSEFAPSLRDHLVGLSTIRMDYVCSFIKEILPGVISQQVKKSTDCTLELDLKVDAAISNSQINCLALALSIMTQKSVILNAKFVNCSEEVFKSVIARQQAPANLRLRINSAVADALDPKEFFSLLGEIQNFENGARCPHLDAVKDFIEYEESRLDGIDNFVKPQIIEGASSLEIRHNFPLTKLIQQDFLNYLLALADLAESTEVIVTLEATAKTREVALVKPSDPYNRPTKKYYELALTSLSTELKDLFAGSRVHPNGSKIELITCFDQLPAYAQEKLLNYLQEFRIPITLKSVELIPQAFTKFNFERTLEFLLPNNCLLHSLHIDSRNVTLELIGQVPADWPEIKEFLEKLYSINIDQKYFNLPNATLNIILSSGPALSHSLAKLVDNEGLVRHSMQEIFNTLERDRHPSIEFEERMFHGSTPDEKIYPRLNLPFVGIGGTETIHDDAFWIERSGKNFELKVAIVDTSEFAPEGSLIAHAMTRSGASEYFDFRTPLHMLPWSTVARSGSFAINRFRPAIVVSFLLDSNGNALRSSEVDLAQIALSHIVPYSAVAAPSKVEVSELNSLSSPKQNLAVMCSAYHEVSLGLDARCAVEGGLVNVNDRISLSQVQRLVNCTLTQFALDNGLTFIQREFEAPSIAVRKEIISFLSWQHDANGLPRPVFSVDEIEDARLFRQKVSELIKVLPETCMRQMISLSKSRGVNVVNPEALHFWQGDQPYSQVTAGLRRSTARVLQEQISRFLRGEAPIPDAAMIAYANRANQIEQDTKFIRTLMESCSTFGNVEISEVIHYRGKIALDGVMRTPALPYITNSGFNLKFGNMVKAQIIGFDVASGMGVAQVLTSY